MDMTGKNLGKYVLLERLGKGGMAEVYKARQPLIERLVAIKVMLPDLAASPQFVERFRREAQRMGQLRHPNIVSVLDFDIIDGTNFLVMDYVEGMALRQHLARKQRLSPEETLRIAAQVLDALQYAHERGVVHCDLSPGNVMFSDDTCQQVLLTDFGLARLMDSSGQAQTSTVIGTPAYISPEALASQPFDGRADLYALGVMIYEMLTGTPPFTGDTPVSVIVKHLNEPAPNLRVSHPEYPEELAALVETAMAKDPNQRYRNAAAMRQAVERAMQRLQQDGQPRFGRLEQADPATVVVSGMERGTVVHEQVAEDGSPQTILAPGAAPGARPQAASARRFPMAALAGGAVALFVLVCGTIGFATWSRWGGAIFAGQATPTAVAQAATPTPVATAVGGVITTPTPVEAVNPPDGGPVAPVEADRYGEFTVVLDSQGSPSNFLVSLQPVALPPAGAGYVAWAGDGAQFVRLGELSVNNGRARLFGPLPEGLQDLLLQVRVTLENDPANASAPGDPVLYSGEYSPERQAAFRQLAFTSSEATGKPYIGAILEQASQALNHQGFALDALQAGNQAMARAHAEHVVNILDGKAGASYGDVDGNGQVQNPGDDVGVRQYMEQARSQIQAAVNAAPKTEARLSHAAVLDEAYRSALQAVQEIIALNVKLQSVGEAGEQLSLVQEGQARLQSLIFGDSGLDGLWIAGQDSLWVANLALSGQEAQVGFDAAGETAQDVWLEVDARNNFVMQIDRLSMAPAGYVLALWGVRQSDEGFEALGSLPDGAAEFRGQLAKDPFTTYSRMIVSLELASQVLTAPTRLILVGEVNPASGGVLARLTTTRQDGPLNKAEEQALLAIEHMNYLADALNQNNLALAKRHAEHVVNILEGKDGPHFGDVNADGNLQNPGDGVGVLGYLRQIEQVIQEISGEDFSIPQQARFIGLQKTLEITAATIEAVYEAALKVFASDTIEEARVNSQPMASLVSAVLAGLDHDENTALDPLAGEAGLQGIRELAQALRVIILRR